MVICALTKKPYALDIVMVCPANSSSSLSSPNSIVISDIFSLDSSSSSRGFIFVSHSCTAFCTACCCSSDISSSSIWYVRIPSSKLLPHVQHICMESSSSKSSSSKSSSS